MKFINRLSPAYLLVGILFLAGIGGGVYAVSNQAPTSIPAPVITDVQKTPDTPTKATIMEPALVKIGSAWSTYGTKVYCNDTEITGADFKTAHLGPEGLIVSVNGRQCNYNVACDAACAPSGTQPVVSGMSKYTDTDSDYSFWYPSGWAISKATSTNTIVISNAEQAHIGIRVVSATELPTGYKNTIKDKTASGSNIYEFFDQMGGAVFVLPLSDRLIRVNGYVTKTPYAPDEGTLYLVKTITTDPVVGTDEETAITTEKNAYAPQETSLSASPSSGNAPLLVTFGNFGSSTKLDFGEGHSGSLLVEDGSLLRTFQHIYIKSGVYIVRNSDRTATITVTGSVPLSIIEKNHELLSTYDVPGNYNAGVTESTCMVGEKTYYIVGGGNNNSEPRVSENWYYDISGTSVGYKKWKSTGYLSDTKNVLVENTSQVDETNMRCVQWPGENVRL